MALRVLEDDFENNRFNDDKCHTLSSVEQMKVEETVQMCYSYLKDELGLEIDESESSQQEIKEETALPRLKRWKHKKFLLKGLEQLSQSYQCLDASRCWLVYWILHSLDLLSVDLPDPVADRVIEYLGRCQNPDGGFGGGPGQMSHLASTYPSVNALCIVGTEKAYQTINRVKLQEFLQCMHTANGGFIMHQDGEEDIRGAYCAASIAKLTNIMTPEMFDKTPEWVISCQTYEGGFSGFPGLEAHGGYSFCGLAILVLLEHEGLCDLKSLLRWATNRQMKYEGGFQGRTNKLVDGCYSFWQGGAFPLLHMALSKQDSVSENPVSCSKWMFNQGALQEYILACCQYHSGGLIDKPGKSTDYYHTMYCLSGLSVAQHFTSGHHESDHIIGHKDNELKLTHPVFNICVDKALQASQYFRNCPSGDQSMFTD